MTMNRDQGDLVISGDCGGTNTRLSLWLIPHTARHFSGNVAPGEIIYAKKYENENHSSFAEVCHLFMSEANLQGKIPKACVLACAGPILRNTVTFTNIQDGWTINGPALQNELGIPKVKLINDFQAMGYGLLTLKPHEYIVLNEAEAEEGAPKATIGAGTGLGECYLTAGNDGEYSCYACEGGHTDFAPADELEIELYNYIKEWLGCERRFSVERILSGPGLATIYDFLQQKYPDKVNSDIRKEFDEATAFKARVVGTYAKSDELCAQAMDIFVGAYGREAGNAMLKYLPRGGFYITGGLAPKNLDFFTKKDTFLKNCFDKGRVSPALEAIPIYLVLTEDLGERGAHFYAYQLLRTHQQRIGHVDNAPGVDQKYATSNHLALYTAIAATAGAVGAALSAARR